jgi:hypothetical protein
MMNSGTAKKLIDQPAGATLPLIEKLRFARTFRLRLTSFNAL